MKFSQIPSVRPDITTIKNDIRKLLQEFTAAESFQQQNEIFIALNDYCSEYNTADSVAEIRYSTDTLNPLFKSDKKYFDENSPDYFSICKEISEALIKSKFFNEYREKYGATVISKFERDIVLYSDELKEDFILEQELENEYYSVRAGAAITFNGKKYSVQQMAKFQDSPDRETRKLAQDETYNFFFEKKDDFNILFDKLVKIRTEISHKLGFKNFVELGYRRMCKGFSYTDVQKFRKNIIEYIVPLVKKLKEKHRKRIGVEKLMYYDSGYMFRGGNPVVKDEIEQILRKVKFVFSELSPLTKEFINFMMENELINIESRIGRAGGGYQTYLQKYKSPFIFSNFNGTAADIEVLFHEAGHAFQSYICRNYKLLDEMFSTQDINEVHSMSMEFLTYDYMKLFFEEDTDKFYFDQLDGSVRMILTNTIGDEFQETIYLNPGLSIGERADLWKELQKKYGLSREGEGNEYLDSGCSWHVRRHNFTSPFYSIEYALAQFVAYQFLFLKKENHQEAIRKYIEFCKLGGRYTFSESLKIADLKNPFEEGTVKEMAGKVEALIDSIDDSNF